MARRTVEPTNFLKCKCPSCDGAGMTETVRQDAESITFVQDFCDVCDGMGRVTEQRMREFWAKAPAAC